MLVSISSCRNKSYVMDLLQIEVKVTWEIKESVAVAGKKVGKARRESSLLAILQRLSERLSGLCTGQQSHRPSHQAWRRVLDRLVRWSKSLQGVLQTAIVQGHFLSLVITPTYTRLAFTGPHLDLPSWLHSFHQSNSS